MEAVMMNATFRYIPKCDRGLPEEDQTVFLLKALSARDAARMQDSATETSLGSKGGETVMRLLTGTQILKALEMGLKGWENFKDPTGVEVEFRENNGRPRPEMFDYIPPKVRQELAECIIECAFMSEEQEKN